MGSDIGRVWTTTTPVQKGGVTSVDLPDIDPRGKGKAATATFTRRFAEEDQAIWGSAPQQYPKREPREASLALSSDDEDAVERALGPIEDSTRDMVDDAGINRPVGEFVTDTIRPVTPNPGEAGAGLVDVVAREPPVAPASAGEASAPRRNPLRSSRSQFRFYPATFPQASTRVSGAEPAGNDDRHQTSRRTSPQPNMTVQPNRHSLTSPEGVRLECMTASIRKSKHRVGWFRTFSDIRIPKPPALSMDMRLEVGDLFLHIHRSPTTEEDVVQVWMVVKDVGVNTLPEWRPVSDLKTYHPVLPDRVLSFQNVTTPTWVFPNTERRHANKPRIVIG